MSNSILQSHLNVFSTPLIQDKINNTPLVPPDTYKLLHKEFLTPLNLKVDCEQLINQLGMYESYFKRWGNKRDDLARQGCALCNLNGKIDQDDPTIGSLFDWCKQHPTVPIIDSDCRVLTSLMQLSCFRSLQPLTPFFYRSSVLKWKQGAYFSPHIDNHFPYPWIRLWATTDEKVELNYWSTDGVIHRCNDIQKGTLYLIDTSLIHEARWDYTTTLMQLFICLSANSIPLIEELIM